MDKDFPREMATVSDAVDHIDHIVELIGIDYVGIGTDFDGGGGLEDCFDVSQMGNITLELVRRGYTATEIKKIWGGNLTRVFKEVEAADIHIGCGGAVRCAGCGKLPEGREPVGKSGPSCFCRCDGNAHRQHLRQSVADSRPLQRADCRKSVDC